MKKVSVMKACPTCRANQEFVCIARAHGIVEGLRLARRRVQHDKRLYTKGGHVWWALLGVEQYLRRAIKRRTK